MKIKIMKEDKTWSLVSNSTSVLPFIPYPFPLFLIPYYCSFQDVKVGVVLVVVIVIVIDVIVIVIFVILLSLCKTCTHSGRSKENCEKWTPSVPG